MADINSDRVANGAAASEQQMFSDFTKYLLSMSMLRIRQYS